MKKEDLICSGMAEACGSRTQTLDSQLTANDDVAASAKFQLESIGVSPEIDPNKALVPILTATLGLRCAN